MRECLQNKKGHRLYQMEKMAELVVLDDSEYVEFDPKLASSYGYKYDGGNSDSYVYSALEALCYECGCFLWIDMVGVIYFLYTFYLQPLSDKKSLQLQGKTYTYKPQLNLPYRFNWGLQV